jgi:hypothetical protein
MQTLFCDFLANPVQEKGSIMRMNAGSMVGLAAVLVGLLLTAEMQPAAAADGDAIKVDLKTFKFKVPDDRASLFGYDEGESKLFYYTGGPGEVTVKLPADGDYEIAIKASCQSALNERAKFKVSLDGQPVGKETLLTDDDEKEYKLTAAGKAGERKLVIEFTNDIYKEGEYDRNFYLHGITVKPAKYLAASNRRRLTGAWPSFATIVWNRCSMVVCRWS